MTAETRKDLHALLAAVDPPHVVVTVHDGNEAAGCLVGYFTECSIDPPRFLVCLSKRNRTYRVARRSSGLAVQLLAADDRELAELFGGQTGDEVDKFASCDWWALADGTPVLDAAAHWVATRIVERLDVGDHVAFLVEVSDASFGDERPLLRYHDVADIDPGHAP